MTKTEVLYKGSRFTFLVVIQNEQCPIQEFFQTLEETERTKIFHLINVIGHHGPPKNPEKFRNEANDIYALKSHNVRVYGFFHGQGTFVLTHGFKKKAKGGRKAEDRERQRAMKIRADLLQQTEYSP